jgi:ubiquinone/menaquinone biosynthesis C-methylase UbiE
VNQIQYGRMNCDRIAPYYEVLEHLSFGKRLEQRRFAFLGEMRTSQTAIVCGGGDGRFLARLLRINSRLEVDYIELSRKMIELAERRVTGMGQTFRERVRFVAGDVRECPLRLDGYDLIVTHFFLDCFSESEVADVVSRLAQCATPGALWVLSEFREAEGAIARIWTRGVIRSLYLAFRFTTGLQVTRLPDHVGALSAEGFCARREERALGGLLYSSVWQLGIPLTESFKGESENGPI